MNRRRLLIIAVLVAIILVSYMSLLAFRDSKRTATLDIEVAPSGSTLKLNHNGVRAGVHKVMPGSYSLTATRSGFKNDSTTVVVNKNQSKVIGLVLLSNSNTTSDWYKNHPKDELLAESITGRKFDQSTQDLTAKNPLLRKLPFIGAGFEFRIDSGKSQKGSSQPAIYIRSLSQVAQDDAILWIKSQGYDPSTMEVVFLHDSPASPTNLSTGD